MSPAIRPRLGSAGRCGPAQALAPAANDLFHSSALGQYLHRAARFDVGERSIRISVLLRPAGRSGVCACPSRVVTADETYAAACRRGNVRRLETCSLDKETQASYSHDKRETTKRLVERAG